MYHFLKNYGESTSVAFEDKPIDIKSSRNVTIYKISVSKHSNCYNFEDGNRKQFFKQR